jgi:hypothetical protein
MAMGVSVKRIQIDKANSTIVIAVAVAAFCLTFSLISARALIARQSYQNKVVKAREDALKQLEENVKAVEGLKVKYTEFISRSENLIGGSSAGAGERDGDNARIVLDALPSKYDFPALASSLEKVLADRNYKILAITGTDDEINQNGTADTSTDPDVAAAAAAAAANAAPTATTPTVGGAVPMPFELGAEGQYDPITDLLSVFRHSIRPIQVKTITMTAVEGAIQLTVSGQSFFQPERTLNVKEEVVP